MNTRTLLTPAVAILLPRTLPAQGLARGGIGSFLFDFEGDYDGVEYTVTPPSFTVTLGLDVYPTGIEG